MRKNYMELWNYETMGVIELQSYRTIELQRISLKSYGELGVQEVQEYRSIGVQELGLVKELLRRQRELSKESLGRFSINNNGSKQTGRQTK